MRRRWWRALQALGLSAASAAAAAAIGELALAVRGDRPLWRYASGWAIDDLSCRYRLAPGTRADLFGCAARINSLGTRGPEPRTPEVLALGDSCTFGVELPEEATYPGLLSRRGFETVNAGVPGYNTYTALRSLEDSRLTSLSPKLVTLYFGWNDHWRSLATERAFHRLRRLSRFSRIASRLLAAQAGLWSQDPAWRRFRWFPQVPLGQFKKNLKALIAASRSAGAVVVVVTAPWEPRLAEDGRGWFASHGMAELQDHPRYAAAAREAAAETGAGLVDLEAVLRERAAPDPHEFFLDFAHLNA